jgi:hypothetical protein
MAGGLPAKALLTWLTRIKRLNSFLGMTVFL